MSGARDTELNQIDTVSVLKSFNKIEVPDGGFKFSINKYPFPVILFKTSFNYKYRELSLKNQII